MTLVNPGQDTETGMDIVGSGPSPKSRRRTTQQHAAPQASHNPAVLCSHEEVPRDHLEKVRAQSLNVRSDPASGGTGCRTAATRAQFAPSVVPTPPSPRVDQPCAWKLQERGRAGPSTAQESF